MFNRRIKAVRQTIFGLSVAAVAAVSNQNNYIMNADNKVELTGFAGSNAELKEVGNNKKLARVNIAIHENYKNATGAEVKNTHWFSLVFCNAKAEEAIKLIKKGTRFSIQGRLSAQSYEAKDGTKRYNTEIVVNEITVLSAAAEEEKSKNE